VSCAPRGAGGGLHSGRHAGRRAGRTSEDERPIEGSSGGSVTREERRYSPPRIIAATKTPIHGQPDEGRICTSHAERLNLDVRMKNRRFTRQTNAFSKLFRNHRASVALTVAHYNLCKMHSSIRMTPAMKAGLTNRIWSVGDLLAA
jgi:hypothetical protein